MSGKDVYFFPIKKVKFGIYRSAYSSPQEVFKKIYHEIKLFKPIQKENIVDNAEAVAILLHHLLPFPQK